MIGYLILFATYFVALVLMAAPLPGWLPAEVGYLRPDLMLLTIIYWVLALPQRLSLVTAWLLGVLMDVLLGSPIGLHALCYVLVAFVVARIHPRIRMFSVIQQSAVVLGMLGACQFLKFTVESLAGVRAYGAWDLLPVIAGGLLWPLAFRLLRYLRREFQVT